MACRTREGAEPVGVEALVERASVDALGERVLRGLAATSLGHQRKRAHCKRNCCMGPAHGYHLLNATLLHIGVQNSDSA